VQVSVKPNGATLGKKAGPKMGAITKALATASFDEVQKLDAGEKIEIEGISLGLEDVRIYRQSVAGALPSAASSLVVVALDVSVERDQELEGLAREVVNRIQKLRKDSQLHLADRIQLQIKADGDLSEAVKTWSEFIQDQTLAQAADLVNDVQGKHRQTFEIDGNSLEVGLTVVT
jgi:isoleucyl-tRNA synthetase